VNKARRCWASGLPRVMGRPFARECEHRRKLTQDAARTGSATGNGLRAIAGGWDGNRSLTLLGQCRRDLLGSQSPSKAAAAQPSGGFFVPARTCFRGLMPEYCGLGQSFCILLRRDFSMPREGNDKKVDFFSTACSWILTV
jgi:hypothetical protein